MHVSQDWKFSFFVGEKIGLDKTFLYFKYSLQVRIYALFSGIEGLVERTAGHQMSMNLYCVILWNTDLDQLFLSISHIVKLVINLYSDDMVLFNMVYIFLKSPYTSHSLQLIILCHFHYFWCDMLPQWCLTV